MWDRDSTRSRFAYFLVALAGCGVDAPPLGSDATIDSTSQPSFTQGWNLAGEIFGTLQNDEATDVIMATNGQLWVAGYENGRLGATSVDPSGDTTGVIYSFYDDTGGFRRNSSSSFRLGAGNGVTEVIEAISLVPNQSDIYMTGRTTGSVSSTISGCQSTANAGQFDAFVGWVSGLNSSAPRCLKQFGTARPQHPRRLSVSGSGQLTIAGYDDIYIPTNYVEAWEDPFIMRAQRQGNSLNAVTGWPLQYGTSGADVLLGMTSGSQLDAPIYITTSTASGAGRGVAVRKLRVDKSVEWSSPVSAIGFDVGAAVHEMPDGRVLFVGSTYGILGESSAGEQDVVLRMLTPEGLIEWTRQYGSTASDLATDVAVDPVDGSIYIVGETLGSFDPQVINDGDQADVFITKLDRDGNSPRTFQLGGPGDEHPSSITVGPSGNVYVAGYTTAQLFSDKPHRGQRDGFVLRVHAPDDVVGPFVR